MTTNYSELCTCEMNAALTSVTICTLCNDAPCDVSINNMPDDVAFISTLQLFNFRKQARQEAMMWRGTANTGHVEFMEYLEVECTDELSRRRYNT